MPSDMDMNVKSTKVIALNSKNIELIIAIQLLADSKHHEFAREWANQMYEKLSTDSLKMLSIVAQTCLQGMELIEFVLEGYIFDDIDELCQTILDYDGIEFLHKITGEQIGIERIKGIVNKKENLNDVIFEFPWLVRENTGALHHAFFETDGYKQAFVNLIKELDNDLFNNKLKELKEKYQKAVEDMSIRIIKTETKALVQEVIGKKWEIKDLEEYYFVPSYFISPHHLMIYNHKSIVIAYDMISDRSAKIEEGKGIASALSVISDKTRLEILRHIISEPTYGKVLAAMLNLTTATISHHLEQLKAAGFIKEHKEKNIKYFSANIEKVDSLLEDVKNYLYNK
ncbi:ArsR/SmtB family transcription factor [Alkaliphilus peptidifermentans]|uniref:DNA-binding transcriptional regulator, ArsR family n=1 Tax=Alkaliphilus peptidifermentans DSM 18978 TaxID=1120976 RepID=A0A1G5L7Y9_9FIRM|nr:metalloregulator ArsR/SmtB family transcription factor [Alkaliphilus peptidifermentans]SCZ08448.1 DNA-binding transcriptional regulator, ArsR family [Alkaliphilus peptidifermentans DSM 18978]